MINHLQKYNNKTTRKQLKSIHIIIKTKTIEIWIPCSLSSWALILRIRGETVAYPAVTWIQNESLSNWGSIRNRMNSSHRKGGTATHRFGLLFLVLNVHPFKCVPFAPFSHPFHRAVCIKHFFSPLATDLKPHLKNPAHCCFLFLVRWTGSC